MPPPETRGPQVAKPLTPFLQLGLADVRPHLAGDEDRRLASRLVMVSAEKLAPDDAIKIVEIEKAA